MKKTKYVQAPSIKRMLAYIIDWYLSSLAAYLSISICHSISAKTIMIQTNLSGLSNTMSCLATLGAIVFVLIYFLLPSLLSNKYHGQTIGKLIMKIRVVHLDNSGIDLKTSLMRYLIGLIFIEQTFNTNVIKLSQKDIKS